MPKGSHSITAYLIVNNAAKAIEFYKKAFGAKVIMTLEKKDGKIAHAELKIGDSKFMLADEYPEMHAVAPLEGQRSSVSMHLYVKNVDGVIITAVSLGAKVTRPVADQFYGDRSGGIEDPFGHQWYVATQIENVTPAKIRKRMAAMGN
ncbi:MAG: VOC family protein [Gammaproteobacteria bacterium]|nr:VOC family protein [Gammaproteobacteria bacterium]